MPIRKPSLHGTASALPITPGQGQVQNHSLAQSSFCADRGRRQKSTGPHLSAHPLSGCARSVQNQKDKWADSGKAPDPPTVQNQAGKCIGRRERHPPSEARKSRTWQVHGKFMDVGKGTRRPLPHFLGRHSWNCAGSSKPGGQVHRTSGKAPAVRSPQTRPCPAPQTGSSAPVEVQRPDRIKNECHLPPQL